MREHLHWPRRGSDSAVETFTKSIKDHVDEQERLRKSFVNHSIARGAEHKPDELLTLQEQARLGLPFISTDKLKELLNEANIRSILGTSASAEYIRQHYLKILATVLYGPEPVRGFNGLYPLLKDAGKSDKDLPFQRDTLGKLNWGQSGQLEQFLFNQYLFNPITIKTADPNNITTDRYLRLPIQHSEYLDTGQNAVIIRADISSDHRQFPRDRNSDRTHSSSKADKPKTVFACKIFQSPHRPYATPNEIHILGKLATCRVPHPNIMLNYASICLDPVFIIVLPFAKYGNLGHFLYGNSVPGLEKEDGYRNGDPHPFSDPNRTYKYEKERFQRDILSQIEKIVSALRWLHKTYPRILGHGEFRFAHLDIKPENILILDIHASESTVGYWVISDFGSAVCERPEEIHNYMTQEAESGSPSRYMDISVPARRQADEYTAPELEDHDSLVGRRSDVWSLVCVIIELITLVLYRDTSKVREFQTARRPRFWHSAMPAVEQWLETLVDEFNPTSNGWVECCLTQLRRYLVPIESRPDSKRLLDDIEHIIEHYETRTMSFSDHCCDKLRAPPVAVRPPPDLPSSSGSLPIPRSPQPTLPHEPPHPYPLPLEDFEVQPVGYMGKGKKNIRTRWHDNGAKSKCIAISNNDGQMAWLYKDKICIRCVTESDYIGHASSRDDVAASGGPTIFKLNSETVKWKDICIAGHYVVAWSRRSTKAFHIFIASIRTGTFAQVPYSSVENFVTMTLSSTGILAFVCSGYIHICHIETLLQRSPNGCTTEAAAVPDAPRKPCSGQSFATAVFNHAGNMLYAWSFGEDPSTLYVYSATAATSFGRVHLSRYSTEHVNTPDVNLVPHAFSLGCVFRLPHNGVLVVADTSQATMSINECHPRRETRPENIMNGAVMYDDTTMLAIVSEPRRHLVRKYVLEKGAGRPNLQQDIDLCQLQRNVDDRSKISVLRINSEGLLVVVCNMDGTSETLKLAKSEPQNGTGDRLILPMLGRNGV